MRDRVVSTAREMLGVRWRHQGRSKTGTDCVGVVVHVLKTLELSDYDDLTYSRDPGYDFVNRLIAAGFSRIPLKDSQPGDMLIFRCSVRPSHLAILTERDGRPHLLHGSAGHRRIVEEPYTDGWKDIVISAWSLPGVV